VRWRPASARRYRYRRVAAPRWHLSATYWQEKVLFEFRLPDEPDFEAKPINSHG